MLFIGNKKYISKKGRQMNIGSNIGIGNENDSQKWVPEKYLFINRGNEN